MELTDEMLKINIKRFFEILRHYITLIAVVTLLAGAVGHAYAEYIITPQYETSVVIYVNAASDPTLSGTAITNSDLSAAKSLADTYAIFIKSKLTLNKVLEETKLPYSYQTLNSMVSASAINSTEVLRVTVRGSSPNDITDIANAIADIVPETISEIITGSSAHVLDYADVPTSKYFPVNRQYAMRGALIGLLCTIGIVLIISFLENQAAVEDILKDRFQLPVLSVIPDMKAADAARKRRRKRGKSGADEDFTIGNQLDFGSSEAYRLLRANLLCCLPDENGCKVIGVTSSNKGEGKTTTSINIAHVLSQKGLKVCLVELDLRIPTIADRLQMQYQSGITHYLSGEANGNEIVHRIQTQGMSFYAIPAGGTAPNPSELIGSKKMMILFDALRKASFDYLIVDLPPVMAVSDPLVAGSLVDGMVMAVREDFFDSKVIMNTTSQLEQADIKMLGYTVTHSTTREKQMQRYKKYGRGKKGTEGYGYGYYTYGYGYGGENSEKDNKTEKKS